MAESAKFWDNIAEKYAAGPIKNEAGYADTLARIRKYLVPDARVLEVGCGTGTSALKLAGDAGHIVATDISPKLVQIATDKGAAAGAANVEFSVASVTDAPGADESYDAVLALNLLMLVPDTPAAITALKGKLKPGGILMSKTAAVGENFLFRIVVPVMQFFGVAPAVQFFTRDELSKKFTDAGMEVVESHDYDESPKRRFIAAKKPLN